MNDTQSEAELIRAMNARLAKAGRPFWIWLAAVCALAVGPVAILWLISIL
jgi:hypothetical protein